MIFKLIIAFYNAFGEELKTGNSWKNKLLLTSRIIFFIASTGFAVLLLLVTLLAEHEGSKTEIMSLYISLVFTVFLLVNFTAPWKVISIKGRFGIIYLITLLLSFLLFCLAQLINLLFHEGTLKWSSLADIYHVYSIIFVLLFTLCVLYWINHKIYHPKQKHKSFKAEWNRLSHWNTTNTNSK